ncbi:hypothetical protein [Micromonospora robiginosa]|uniref:Uncharacterized protein n=1 Tax=Micromonospora robiginosa TaxID=2749844 RepID=A0A7L6B7M6_9ACTN|nr:hypothetical protein [Micromonospora ferruginea]QLQ37976.1 hypothetical protein H1D33_03530 [Micromonospora ferruginea]
MTNPRTAPGVVVQRNASQFDRHPTALKIYVHDGHLFVQSFDADIAIYAPGQWLSAKHGSGRDEQVAS